MDPKSSEKVQKLLPGLSYIDVEMLKMRGTLSTYVIDGGDSIGLVEPGPTQSIPNLLRGLDALSISPDEVSHILVTHVHLDHAGGAGTLARHLPRARVCVSEPGAPHLLDPSKLVTSAARAYNMPSIDPIFGPMEPIPPERLQVVREGETIRVGRVPIQVLETPGHTRTHVSLLFPEMGAIITGDAAGAYYAPRDLSWPLTPPSDFSLEQCLRDQERFQGLSPRWLLTAHFGPVKDPRRHCERIAEAMRKWEPILQEALQNQDPQKLDFRQAAQALKRAAPVQGKVATWVEVVSSYMLNASGFSLYLKKAGKLGTRPPPGEHEPHGV